MTEVNNTYDVIDSRDVFEKVDELESEIGGLKEDSSYLEDLYNPGTLESEIDELEEELKPIKAFADELKEASTESQDGETVVRGSFFETYAQELADDLGLTTDSDTWPLYHIDWDAAADSLKQDYTEVDFDGVTYFIRSV